MKISLNWLKKYVEVPVSDEELMRLIGARLVEVEGVIDETHKYDNIYVVRVVSCEKIPDTHLTLCQIDCGRKEPVQVVCGAPNVREGMMAVWIAPGAVVPASVHEDAPFVIGKRKMRGYESSGMLAGADELDFGDDHSGIVEIDPEMAKPGDLLADVFELNDVVLEIENKSLTHRPDCFGIVGFAREVAGILEQRFEYDFSGTGRLGPSSRASRPHISTEGRPLGVASTRNASVSSTRLLQRSVVTSEMPRKAYSESLLSISLPDSRICQRYSVVVLEKHGEMKRKYLTWVDTILSKSGMRPVDPIVDATNYLMLLTGQPLHAFDYDKFVAVGGREKAEVKVRLAREGEKLALLDDKEIVLNCNDIVICAGDTPVALAGAMGGKSTEIDESTKNIMIESATFSLYNLRKTQMAHGIFTEAITRFTKGQPPYQTFEVAGVCAEMLAEGFRVMGVADEYPEPEKQIVVKITTDEINGLLGTDYTEDLIVKTLENVGFGMKVKRGALEVKVPEWRTDIHIKEDVIEEVGRLLGYDNIKPTLPLHGTAEKNKMWEMKRSVREMMSRYGANEVLTYSFVSGRLLEKVGQSLKESYKIVNSISPELQYIRQSIVPSLLERTYMNEKLPVEKFAIFEMNQVYRKSWGQDKDGVPEGRMILGCVVAERKNTKETAYYKAKKYVAKILAELGVRAEYVPLKQKGAEAKPFEPKRTAEIRVNGVYVGLVGEFKQSVKHEFKLAEYVAGFELDLGLVMEQVPQRRTIEFGARKCEDLTVTTDKDYAETLRKIRKQYPGAEIKPGVIYQAPGQKTKNITFHIAKKLEK